MKQSLRRGLAALLALVLVLGAFPAEAAAASLGEAATSAVSQEEAADTQDEDVIGTTGESDQETTESDDASADTTEDTTDPETEQTEEDAAPSESDEVSETEAAEEDSSAEEDTDPAGEDEAEEEAETPLEEEAAASADATTRTAAYKRSYAEKGTTFRILIIGNSFSVDTSQYLYQVATDAGYDVVVGNLQKSSQTLANHWSYAQNDSAVYTYRKNSTGSWKTIATKSATMAQAVEDEDWDIIFFQQQSTESGDSDSFYDKNGNNYLTLLSNYVVGLCGNEDVKIGFEMTWAFPSSSTDSTFLKKYGGDPLTMYNKICSATKKAVVSSGAVDLIAAVGTAIQNVRSSYIGDTLTRDNKHLSYGLGRYLAAMSLASACGMDLSDITEINTGSYTYSSLNLTVLKQAVADAEKTPYAVTAQSTTTPSLSRPTVTSTTSDGKTTLTWSAVKGATGYRVYRLALSGGTAALLTTLSTGQNSYSYSYSATGYNYYICALGDDYISDKVDASAKVSSSPSITSLSNASNSGLTVKWSAVSTVTGYQVQTATDSSFTKNVQTATATDTSKTTSSRTSGKKYYVRVRAYRTVGNTKSYSSWSAVKSIYCVNTPSISSVANASGNKLTVNWDAVSSVTGYQVQVATDSAFTQNVQTLSATGTSRTTPSCTNGTKYYIRMRAYKTVSGTTYYSAWSGKRGIYCISAPTLSSVANDSGSKLTVKWSAVSSVTGYQVQIATDSAFTQNVQTLSSTDITKTTSSCTNGTRYYVRVRARKTASEINYYSAWSNAKSIYCLSAPSISRLKNVKTRKLTVKWSKNTKATGYQIQYSTSSSFSSYKTVTVSNYKTVSKTISKLSKKKKYYVRVRAYKTVSGTTYYSAWSGKKSVKISK